MSDADDDRESTGPEDGGPEEGGEGAAGTARMDEREAVAADTDELFPRSDRGDEDPDSGDGDADPEG